MTEGMDKLARSTSASEQLAIVKEMQNVFWQDIPYVSFGDTFGTVAIRQAIKGAKTSFGMPINVYSAWRAE
jgi:hypothetical protein